MPITPEDFAEWRQHPVTEWMLKQMEGWAALQKARWAEMAWDNGDIDPLLLREAQVRADCYAEIPSSQLEDWLAIEEQLSDS